MITRERNFQEFVVLELQGEISDADLYKLATTFSSLVQRNIRRLIVDARNVSKIPLFMVKPILKYRNTIEKQQGELILFGFPADIRFILKTAKLDHGMKFCNDIEKLLQERERTTQENQS